MDQSDGNSKTGPCSGSYKYTDKPKFCHAEIREARVPVFLSDAFNYLSYFPNNIMLST